MLISIITVTYNSRNHLETFFSSIEAIDRDGFDIEILVVDNGSTDGSVEFSQQFADNVRVIRNTENNYCKAINLGIQHSHGEFVLLANNDSRVTPGWIRGLLDTISTDPRIGGVQSKILFWDGSTINSVGGEHSGDYYFTDIGFQEPDNGQYDRAAERQYLSGGSVMFRRACLEEVGPFDEDFLMYVEDMDYSQRCRRHNWRLHYTPSSVIYHRFHGSASDELCYYLCNRNRLLFIAKHFPHELPVHIENSLLYKQRSFDLLFRCLAEAARKLFLVHGQQAPPHFEAVCRKIEHLFGPIAAINLISHVELLLNLRKIRLGIYDHACHADGPQYGAEIAHALQNRYEVTLVSYHEGILSHYQHRNGLDLKNCSVRVIRQWPDKPKQTGLAFIIKNMGIRQTNPFDIIAMESLNYDIFVNVNASTMINPLALRSLFISHALPHKKDRFFQVHKYDYLAASSQYTATWIQERWGLSASHLLYPPVEMRHPDSTPDDKEKLILSVAPPGRRGVAQQLELIRAFSELTQRYPDTMQDWRLLLVSRHVSGGNSDFDSVQAVAAKIDRPIETYVVKSWEEVRDFYRRAAIFWHTSGLDENQPELGEEFTTTTVEAMQNYCVPVVSAGGGQREIVTEGVSGFLFSSLDELREKTLVLIRDAHRRRQMAGKAFARSHAFNREAFLKQVEKIFAVIEAEICGTDCLPTPPPNNDDSSQGESDAFSCP